MMKNKIVIFPGLILMLALKLSAQQVTPLSELPLQIFSPATNDTSKPLIIYFTGDGGFNSFSTGFAKQLSATGYPVVSFNCLKYFWRTKAPEQAAVDASEVIQNYQNTYKRKRIVLIGYSFGADVVPFIYTRLSPALQSQTQHLVLLSPANHTDFAVHVTEMLGGSNKGNPNVLNEVNKISNKPFLIIAGEKEDGGLNISALKINNYKKLTIPGGHHYDSDPSFVVRTIIQNL